MKTESSMRMMKTLIQVLVVGASLAMSVARADDSAPALRVDESAHQLEAQTKVNPFDAIALNNEAVKMSRDGSQLDAAQLLSRAHRLAPDNKVIERNYQALNDWMAKRTSASQPLDTDQAARKQWPEPPPLWGNAPSVATGQGQRK